MYVVFVLATILLTIAPMHAQTMLAVFPANGSVHPFAALEAVAETKTPDVRIARRTVAPAILFPAATVAPRLRPAAAVFLPGRGLTEHAPNAP